MNDETTVVVKQEVQTPTVEKRTITGRLGPGFWISAGVTFVSASLLATFGALTLSTKKEFDENETESTRLQGEKYKLVTNIMIGITGAAGVATVVTAVIDTKRYKQKNKSVTLKPGPGLSVAGTF